MAEAGFKSRQPGPSTCSSTTTLNLPQEAGCVHWRNSVAPCCPDLHSSTLALALAPALLAGSALHTAEPHSGSFASVLCACSVVYSSLWPCGLQPYLRMGTPPVASGSSNCTCAVLEYGSTWSMDGEDGVSVGKTQMETQVSWIC